MQLNTDDYEPTKKYLKKLERETKRELKKAHKKAKKNNKDTKNKLEPLAPSSKSALIIN